MTCIIGWTDGKKTWMGADSCASNGSTKSSRLDTKMWKTNNFLIGCTTSFRMIQLLKYGKNSKGERLSDIVVPDVTDLEEFMVCEFVERIRTILKDGGFGKIDSNRESHGTFLIAFKNGQLFGVCDDLQVGRTQRGMEACGCGGTAAMSALLALSKHDPSINKEIAIKTSLEVASATCCGVEGPFYIDSI